MMSNIKLCHDLLFNVSIGIDEKGIFSKIQSTLSLADTDRTSRFVR